MAPPPAVETVSQARKDSVTTLPVEALRRGRYQPRDDIREDALAGLADSIKSQGVIQPIIVRRLLAAAEGEPGYEIIAGERRWRAAQLAGLADIPVVVREVSDKAAVAMALIENIQREDLNPLEEAEALLRLIAEFDLTHQQAAESIGRSRAAVSNLLRLTELSREVQSLVRERALEMGHARALLGITDANRQLMLAKRVISGQLSVRQTEQLVKSENNPANAAKKSPAPADPNVRSLETELSDKLGARVSLQQAKNGSGKMIIDYHSLDELDGILAHIK